MVCNRASMIALQKEIITLFRTITAECFSFAHFLNSLSHGIYVEVLKAMLHRRYQDE